MVPRTVVNNFWSHKTNMGWETGRTNTDPSSMWADCHKVIYNDFPNVFSQNIILFTLEIFYIFVGVELKFF